MLQPLPQSKAEQIPTVIQHTLDQESPPPRVEKHARNPEVGQDVVSTGGQRLAVCPSGVTDGEVGVLSVSGCFQGDFVCLGVSQRSRIDGRFDRNPQFRVRQGVGTGGLSEHGTAEVDKEDLVTECSYQSRE